MREAYALVGLAAIIVAVGAWYAFHTSPANIVDTKEKGIMSPSTLSLTSTAFEHKASMPSKYTCDGPNTSPPLSWGGTPEGTASFALIMDDPDAPGGTWDHWIVFNISPSVHGVAEGEEPEGMPGTSSFGSTGYGGPCPPSGTHRYVFRMYALDRDLDLQGGASKQEVLDAMKEHIIAQAELIGMYQRTTQ